MKVYWSENGLKFTWSICATSKGIIKGIYKIVHTRKGLRVVREIALVHKHSKKQEVLFEEWYSIDDIKVLIDALTSLVSSLNVEESPRAELRRAIMILEHACRLLEVK